MFSDSFKKQIKLKLQELEDELVQSVQVSQKSAKPVKLDQQSVGRVSRIDAIQQQQLSLNALNRLKRRLEQVRQTLKKIDTDDFGLCRICEEPISEKRLLTRPEHSLCLSCTRSKEA